MEIRQDISDLFENVLRRRVEEQRLRAGIMEDYSPMTSAQSLLFSAKFDVRFYALSARQHFSDLWETVREDEEQLDFLMGLRSEIFARLGEKQWVEIGALVAQAIARHLTGRQSVIDEDTANRLPEYHWLNDAVNDNDWVVVLYLIHITRLPMEFLHVQQK